MQWNLGPCRWVLSPPLGIFRSHVSSSLLLFSHRLSLVLGKAGEAKRPSWRQPSPETRGPPDFLSSSQPFSEGLRAGAQGTTERVVCMVQLHPRPKRGVWAHASCQARLQTWGRRDAFTCRAVRARLRESACSRAGWASPPCALSPPSLLPHSCQTLCVPRCCLSSVPCHWWVGLWGGARQASVLSRERGQEGTGPSL